MRFTQHRIAHNSTAKKFASKSQMSQESPVESEEACLANAICVQQPDSSDEDEDESEDFLPEIIVGDDTDDMYT